MKSWILTAVLVLSTQLPAGATQMSDLAASMQPGQWAELGTSNASAALSASGASGFIFGYTEELRWDPKTRRLFYVGGDHGDAMRYVTYTESNNSWQVPAQPSWLPGATHHGYDHMAMDPGRGVFYARDGYYGTVLRTLDTATNAWSVTPQNTLLEYVQCCGGIEFFPEMDGVVWAQGGETTTGGGLFIYRVATSQWERLGKDLPMGNYSNFLEYSPVHKVCVFGGGNDNSRAFYKLNASGQVTRLSDAPLNLGIQESIVTVDPATGDFLIFAAGNVFYTYNPTTNTWKHLSCSSPVFNVSMVHGIVAAPISTHGVVLFVKPESGSFHVVLYKHAAGGTVVDPGDTAAPSVPAGLTAAAASSTQINLSWQACTDNVGVAGYIVYRNSSQVVTTTARSYQDTGLSPSTSYDYFVTAIDAAGNESAHSSVARATTSGSVNPPPIGGGGDPDEDFLFRSSGSGVIRAFSFDSQAETDPHIMPPWGTTTKKAKVVTDVKASGDGSLRFEIPSLSGSDTSGSFWLNFSDDLSRRFGEGQQFYVQFRQRLSPEYLNTHYSGGGGWKQIIIGEGDRPGYTAYSCTQLEVVVNNNLYRGFPQMYHSCGGKDGSYEGLEVPFGSYDFQLENAMPAPYCLYSTANNNPSANNCFFYKANQWLTFQVRVRIGTWYKNDRNYHKDSIVQLWVAEEGQPAQLVIDRSDYDLANDDPDAKYGKVWLLPYNSGKDGSVSYPVAYTWYDELIISTDRIPDPAQPADTIAPAAPKNLTIR